MQLSVCGYHMSEEDQIRAILNGVDKDYDLVHATISSKIKSLTVRKVQAMLLTHEKKITQYWKQ